MDYSEASSTRSECPTPTTSQSQTLEMSLVGDRVSSMTLAGPSRPSPAQAVAVAPPSGPLRITKLDESSWRPQYPRMGHFAMTASEEVIAAGPDGLFFFQRVQDHNSKPWSSPRYFPSEPLDSSCVSGIALYEDEPRLDVFCVANGVLHSFSRSTEKDQNGPPSFVADSSPPLATYRVSGTPSVATTMANPNNRSSQRRCSLVVPSQSGGLLHTSTIGPEIDPQCAGRTKTEWGPVDHVATHLGIISAVCVVGSTTRDENNARKNYIIAVCITNGRLRSVEGPCPAVDGWRYSWKGEITHKIHHPGEVTGNPALLAMSTGIHKTQLDLLVPSAEGGIFHFVRTMSTPYEWHMIGRIGFPSTLPPAGSLAFFREFSDEYILLRVALQIGGQFYTTQTNEGRYAWTNCQLQPVTWPGPSRD